MKKMSSAEAREFLLSGARTAKLATVRADGRPHVAPIWFLLDGDDLVFNTWHKSVKAMNLKRDGRVSLCVDDETPPFAFVLIEGTAYISDELTAVKHWATRIAARYMGEDQAAAYGKRNGVPGKLLIRVTITKIVAQKEIAA